MHDPARHSAWESLSGRRDGHAIFDVQGKRAHFELAQVSRSAPTSARDLATAAPGQHPGQQPSSVVTTQSAFDWHCASGAGLGARAGASSQAPARQTARKSDTGSACSQEMPLQLGREQSTTAQCLRSASSRDDDRARGLAGQHPPQQPAKVVTSQSESARQASTGLSEGTRGGGTSAQHTADTATRTSAARMAASDSRTRAASRTGRMPVRRRAGRGRSGNRSP